MATLDIKAEFDKIREQYQGKRPSVNVLGIGDPGSGKTFSLATARFPLLLMQFDPGGAVGIQEHVDNGDIIVADYSGEDPSRADAFSQWERDLLGWQRSGLINQFATVALDSITTWTQSLMYAILKANGRGVQSGPQRLKHSSGSTVAIPELRDYQLQIATVGQYMGLLTGIDPDFIALAHASYEKNDDGAIIRADPLVTGKLKQQLPLLFDEVYWYLPKKSSSGPEYRVLTQPYRYYDARSRLSAGSKLDQFEPADIKAILKKVGRDASDLTPTEA